MATKVRHIDYYPDEMVAGVAGQLDAAEFGMYWMICTLVYSRGGPIADDARWLARMFSATNPRTVRSLVDRLVASGKVARSDSIRGPELMVSRCETELNKAVKRISKNPENGAKGGRPPKENNDLENPSGFEEKTLTTNHQPPTTTEKEEPSGSSKSRDDDEFREWYAQYPRKVDPGRAAKAYRAARKIASAADLLAGALRYSAECDGKDPQYIKHPATWLNARSWLNEPEPSRPSNGKSPTHGSAKLSHSESIFASFAIALGDGERQADCGADRDLAGPLLDAGDGAGSARPFEP